MESVVIRVARSYESTLLTTIQLVSSPNLVPTISLVKLRSHQ